MHTALEFSVHAQQRRLERKAPPSVVNELRTTAIRLVGHAINGQRIEYRVVKHGGTFWVAPVVLGRAATIYAVEGCEARSWARCHLLNAEQSLVRLLRLTSHRTPDEKATDELAAIWLDQEPVAGRGQVRA